MFLNIFWYFGPIHHTSCSGCNGIELDFHQTILLWSVSSCILKGNWQLPLASCYFLFQCFVLTSVVTSDCCYIMTSFDPRIDLRTSGFNHSIFCYNMFLFISRFRNYQKIQFIIGFFFYDFIVKTESSEADAREIFRQLGIHQKMRQSQKLMELSNRMKILRERGKSNVRKREQMCVIKYTGCTRQQQPPRMQKRIPFEFGVSYFY